MRFSIKKLLVITAGIAFAVWFVHSAYVGVTAIETGENVSFVDWLPETASNVSFYRSYMYTAYEFDITESEFIKWSSWDLAEISDPVSLARYKLLDTEIPDLGSNPSDDDVEAFMTARAEQTATIDDGLYYGYLQDNGGGVWAGYDRKRGRAFYQSAPR